MILHQRKRGNSSVTKTLAGLLVATKEHTDALIDAKIVSNDELKYVFADRQARAKVAKQLADEGMSTRQIAAMAGVSHQTIMRDTGGPNGPKCDITFHKICDLAVQDPGGRVMSFEGRSFRNAAARLADRRRQFKHTSKKKD